MKQWKTVYEASSIKEIETFGEDLRRLAKKFKLEILKNYAINLLTYTESFDIDNIKTHLETFTSLIDTLKKKISNKK
ncbi:hypothetical protein ES705_44766 [subsurface metagenome]